MDKHKYCAVPMCKNTGVKTPNKVFFSVPRSQKRRDEWCKMMRRPPLLGGSYVCEDHFNLEEDVKNYWECRLMNAAPKLKPDAVPSRFVCQKHPEEMSAHEHQSKKQKIDENQIEDLSLTSKPSTSQPSTSQHILSDNSNMSSIPSTSKSSTYQILPDIEHIKENINPNDKGVYVNIKPHMQSRKTNTEMQVNVAKHFRSKGTNTPLVNKKNIAPPKSVDKSTSPMRIKSFQSSSPSSSSAVQSSSSSNFQEEVDETSEGSSLNDEFDNFNIRILETSIEAVERYPRLFLGLPKASFFLVQTLSENIPASTRDIMITLRKIRVNESFNIIAVHFGMSESNVSRIFKKTLVPMAQKMQELIYWPDSQAVKLHLPEAFRARYRDIVSIVDCFEIEMEKPSNPAEQALTYSKYYGCNTLKYMISSTPNGLVNFVSNGYGGRASDLCILEACNYLNNLDPGMAVMADRGFKNISHLLEARQCKLVRPPSVVTGVRCTREEVKAAKRIAALRIHIERVIGRLREFKMLLPHACADNHLVSYYDFIVKIACGIINMQDHLIKNQL